MTTVHVSTLSAHPPPVSHLPVGEALGAPTQENVA